MFPEEFLLTISELAVAVVGFSGVVAILGHRGRGDCRPSELLQPRTPVEPSSFVLFGSLAPSTIQLVTESEAVTLRLTSAVFSVLELVGLLSLLWRTRSVVITTGQRVLVLASIH